MLNRATALLNFADADAQFQRRYCSISPAEALNFNAVCIFGQRHKRYLKEHHRLIYFNLLTSCKLAAYLADIDSQANEMYDLLVRQLSEEENISEQLKSDNPIEWARKMNTIRLTATEIVNREIIYT